MSPASEQEKLDDLAARIKDAQAPKTTKKANPESAGMGRAGFDLMAAILGGTLAGWLIDRSMPSLSPWGLIGLMLIGFVVGIMNVWRAMSAQTDTDAEDTGSKG